MSDPIAVSILSKLTSWYDFEGNLNDSHGPYPLTGSVVSGYEAGKVGQSLKRLSRAFAVLPSTPITSTSGKFSIGAWMNFTTTVNDVHSFGLTTNPGVPQNEAIFIDNNGPGSNFYAFGFTQGSVFWGAADPSTPAIRYPFMVQATDAHGLSSVLDTHIDVSGAGSIPPGWYFVVATFEDGFMRLYVNASLKASASPPSSIKTPIT